MLTALTAVAGSPLIAALTFGILRNTTPRPPRKPCLTCANQSRNHPAGPLRRYTRGRDAYGRPHCHRHPRKAAQ